MSQKLMSKNEQRYMFLISVHLSKAFQVKIRAFPGQCRTFCANIYVWIYENRVEDCTKIAGMFLENRSDSVHKYGHVVLGVQSTLCTLHRSYTLPLPAFKIAAN